MRLEQFQLGLGLFRRHQSPAFGLIFHDPGDFIPGLLQIRTSKTTAYAVFQGRRGTKAVNLLHSERGPVHHRAVEKGVQPDQATQLAGYRSLVPETVVPWMVPARGSDPSGPIYESGRITGGRSMEERRVTRSPLWRPHPFPQFRAWLGKPASRKG